ncbi:hemicentin-2-like [Saccostrea cucullata]|uniref:hemicentin-2-like n=1 Tax=Saccostrea cuccullata TaxID=36930 RepID=UPI002ED51139
MKELKLHLLIVFLVLSCCVSEAPPKAKRKNILEVKLKQGENGNLHCNITGDPHPTYTWEKYTYWWKKVKVFPTKKEVLRLENVNSADAGIYLCTAENRLGKAGHRFVVRVPTTPEIIRFEVLEAGHMYCQAKGYPVPDITWEKATGSQWIPLESGVKYSSEFIRKKTMILGYLAILSPSPEDQGIYRCSAENSVGVAKKDISLNGQLI